MLDLTKTPPCPDCGSRTHSRLVSAGTWWTYCDECGWRTSESTPLTWDMLAARDPRIAALVEEVRRLQPRPEARCRPLPVIIGGRRTNVDCELAPGHPGDCCANFGNACSASWGEYGYALLGAPDWLIDLDRYGEATP